MDPVTTAPSPEETALGNIGFSPDANEEETTSSEVATEEAEHAEEVLTEEQAEESREEGTEEVPEEEAAAGSEEESTEATDDEVPHGYDMLLPNQQQKEYPDELRQLAIKKFGLDQLNLSEEQLASNQFRSFVKGKIDSDIEIRNLRDRLDTGAEEDDTIVDEEAAPAAATREEVAVTPQRQLEASNNFLRGGADGQTPILTREGAKMYSESSLAAYTEMQEAVDSGDPKKIEAAQMKYTESQGAFLTLMLAKIMPEFLPHMIQNLPEQIWDGIVGAKLEQRDEWKENHKSARDQLIKDPRYADLDGMIKSRAIFNFVQENPELMTKQFVDQDGRKITDPVKLEMARYRYVVHQIRGQNYRPATELVKKGMDAGKRQANAMAEKKANGRLATGRTRGNLGSSQDRYDPKNWAERMKRSSEAANPLGAFLDNAK